MVEQKKDDDKIIQILQEDLAKANDFIMKAQETKDSKQIDS